MDTTSFIAGLPAEQRETGTIGAVSATVGLASVSAEVAANLYGSASRYRGTRYIIIGVHRYPGTLRRIDLGQDVV
jgi:hypothetical protein